MKQWRPGKAAEVDLLITTKQNDPGIGSPCLRELDRAISQVYQTLAQVTRWKVTSYF